MIPTSQALLPPTSPWPADWRSQHSAPPLPPTCNTSEHCARHYLPSITPPHTLSKRKPPTVLDFSISQLRLAQEPLEFTQHPTMLSSAWTLLCRLHSHWHPSQATLANTPISAELSLRYWHSTGTITNYSTIHISTHADYDQAWIPEHLYISNWQPTL